MWNLISVSKLLIWTHNPLPPYVSTGRHLEGPCTVILAVLLPLIVSDTKSWIGIVLTAAVPALLDRIPEYKHRDP